MPDIRDAVIIGANRIPFARAHGAYAKASNQDMLTSALKGLVARYGLQGKRMGAIAGGAVMKHSKNFNLVRESVLGTPIASNTPAYDVQMACATGMEAIGSLANKIKLGQIDSAIGSGVDSISDAPIVVTDALRSIIMEANRAKTTGQRLKALAKIRPGHLAPQAPGVNEPRTGLSMGEHMAITADQWGIDRKSTRLNSSHVSISYAVFCLKKKKKTKKMNNNETNERATMHSHIKMTGQQ